ncbi:hemin receptor [Tenacibaculum sp. IB213877]|uniref:OmpP1/FadL family transporter n=1 Tax=Tenacibaculum sp. IB213877 TaxID=3097351 RepID=UPI002A5A2FB9|nr:hemin receptor [Tenacibaculum sp. IB213877]MDY0780721.1 hemin receptor [Tenacibaculum sp. IB213877]
MKKVLTFVALATVTFTSFAQSLSYNDLGVLFSKDDNYGTARFEAMSGAFGALGGDVSATGINPAGGAVAINNKFSITLNNRNTDYSSSYYGNNTAFQDDYFNISQAGGILSFDTAYNSDWNRFAFTFNYRMKKDFDGYYSVQGNSGALFYPEHFSDNSATPTQFDRSIDQYAESSTSGQTSVFNVGFSAVHQNKLFVGASLNFHDLRYHQTAYLNEINDDVDGNILDIAEVEDIIYDGSGFSLSFGFIYKFDQNLRLGLAYETPTWYQEIVEDYANRLTMDGVSNLDLETYDDTFIADLYVYKFKSPSRLTASGAYIFGKDGLISVDYTYKDYKNIKYRDPGFEQENSNFTNNYRGTHALNIGAEWRFDKMRVRAGYHYEKDPNLLAGGNTNKDNVRGFSAGLGYNFGNVKFDLGYTNSENKEFYSLYNNGDVVLDNNTSRISGTLTFNL